jgi:sugar/nucleoside kinase (ribokinase family)
MLSGPLLRYIIAGSLRRDYLLTSKGEIQIDIPGGNLLYASMGLRLWDVDIGLLSRVGEDYPQEWFDLFLKIGLDTRGIKILAERIDLRQFIADVDLETRNSENLASHFNRFRIPFPKSLLGYTTPIPQTCSRNQPSFETIRLSDIPSEYQDSNAIHLCPLDFLSHSQLPPTLRQSQVTTVTIDPSEGYMNPIFWNDIPSILRYTTAFLTSEQKISNLFQGRSTDLWEMAETLANYGCEIIVIKRKARGQFVYDHPGHKRWFIPAYPARVVDLTGAGDAFCGGFLAGYRKNYDPLEAALHGNISASMIIEGVGAFYSYDALPGLAQARLDSIRSSPRKV